MEKNQTNLFLYEKIKEVYEEAGLPYLVPIEANGGADSADMAHAGIPCLDFFGTQGGKIHTVEEFMYKKSLVESAKRLSAVAYLIK
jgi:acetylornithine deacetylase/succinyl-diaminopimelate desuccinylase-like protein